MASITYYLPFRKKINCPSCGKRISWRGVGQHIRSKHYGEGFFVDHKFWKPSPDIPQVKEQEE